MTLGRFGRFDDKSSDASAEIAVNRIIAATITMKTIGLLFGEYIFPFRPHFRFVGRFLAIIAMLNN